MRWRRASVCLAWAVAALFVATSAARLVPVVRDHLAATFDLMSEGPHMSTVKALERGDDIYDPRSFLDLPHGEQVNVLTRLRDGARPRAG